MARVPFGGIPDQVADIQENHQAIRSNGIFGIEGEWSMPLGLWRARDGFDVVYRAHDHASLSYVRAGGPVERMDGKFTGRKGGAHPDSFMLYPGGETRRYRAEGPVSICQIYFRSAFLASVFEGDADSSSVGLELRDDRILTTDALLRRMADVYVDRASDRQAPPSLLEVESHSVLLTIHLLRHHSNRALKSRPAAKGLAPRTLQRALDFIEANLAGNVSLSHLAGLLDLSPRYFCTAFRHSTGLPPHRYVTMRRVERAKALLLGGERLAEVALICGFSSQQHFTSIFRQATSLSPGAWLRTLKA